MDIYTPTAYKISKLLTKKYSTSFSLSTTLFQKEIRKHIYAIYGILRIADEIVDSYRGPATSTMLKELELETYRAIKLGYSTNPLIHAFATTANIFEFNTSIIEPFFKSMSMDLTKQVFTPTTYKEYINGSAEVVGLMCLKVFCKGDIFMYSRLEEGAMALGSAYQKINFLRDLAEDQNELGRIYFPNYTYKTFDDNAKKTVIKDIDHDFEIAILAINKLPKSSRIAVMVSYAYYGELLGRLRAASISDIKSKRFRTPINAKLWLMTKSIIRGNLSR